MTNRSARKPFNREGLARLSRKRGGHVADDQAVRVCVDPRELHQELAVCDGVADDRSGEELFDVLNSRIHQVSERGKLFSLLHFSSSGLRRAVGVRRENEYLHAVQNGELEHLLFGWTQHRPCGAYDVVIATGVPNELRRVDSSVHACEDGDDRMANTSRKNVANVRSEIVLDGQLFPDLFGGNRLVVLEVVDAQPVLESETEVDKRAADEKLELRYESHGQKQACDQPNERQADASLPRHGRTIHRTPAAMQQGLEPGSVRRGWV